MCYYLYAVPHWKRENKTSITVIPTDPTLPSKTAIHQNRIKAKQQHEENLKQAKTDVEEEKKQEQQEIKQAKATFLDVIKTIYKEEGYQG